MKIKRTINLKKYKNRKLYSPKGELTDESRYVTVKDFIKAIQEGHTVNVINKGGHDVTNAVLRESLRELDLSSEEMVRLIRG